MKMSRKRRRALEKAEYRSGKEHVGDTVDGGGDSDSDGGGGEAAPRKRTRAPPASDTSQDQLLRELERRGPRLSHPEWIAQDRELSRGRLPLKMPDGRVAKPAPRAGLAKAAAGAAASDDDDAADGAGAGAGQKRLRGKAKQTARLEAKREEKRKHAKQEKLRAEEAAAQQAVGAGGNDDEDEDDEDAVAEGAVPRRARPTRKEQLRKQQEKQQQQLKSKKQQAGGSDSEEDEDDSAADRDAAALDSDALADDDDDAALDAEGEDDPVAAALEAYAEAAASVANDDGLRSLRELTARLSPEEIARRREDRKNLMADLAQRVIADPEHNVYPPDALDKQAAQLAKVKRLTGRDLERALTGSKRADTLLILHQMCGDADPTVRRLAILSLTAVFRDILPGYRIRLPTKAELSVRVKKEVKKLRDFEAALLKSYQRFLQYLEVILKRGDDAHAAILGKESGALAAWEQNQARELGLAAQHTADLAQQEREVAAKRRLAHLPPAVAEAEMAAAKAAAQADGTAAASREHIGGRDYQKQMMQQKRAKKARAKALDVYDADAETVRTLGLTALQALCELLHGLPHFNFRSNIVSLVVPRMSSRREDVSQLCCRAVQELLANDAPGEAGIEVAKALSKEVREASKRPGGMFRVRQEAVAVLCSLRLDVLARSADRDAILKEAQDRAKKMKRLAKLNKGRGDGNPFDAEDMLSGLKAADAEALEERKKNAAAALRATLTVYFRILRTPSAAHLLSPALLGLSTFGHWVDVGVVSDLLASLRALLVTAAGIGSAADDNDDGAAAASGTLDAGSAAKRIKLSVQSSLNCVLTALRIMAGPGELLNADESEFASFLYGTLLRLLDPVVGQPHVPLACEAMEALLLRRREFNMPRVAAFVKRCLFLALHSEQSAAASLVSLTRALLIQYPQTQSLLAPPSEHARVGVSADVGGLDVLAGIAEGSRKAIFECDKPTSLSSTAWEFAALQRHYHPLVRATATEGAKKAPLLPTDAFAAIYSACDFSTGAFNPPIALPKPHPIALRIQREQQEAAAVAAAAAAKSSDKGSGKAPSKPKAHFLHDRPLPAWLHLSPFTAASSDALQKGVRSHFAAARRTRATAAQTILAKVRVLAAEFKATKKQQQ
jgi:hypothetical protein